MWKRGIIVAISLAAFIWVFDRYIWPMHKPPPPRSFPMAEWTFVKSDDTWFGEFDTYHNYTQVKERNGNYIIRSLSNRHNIPYSSNYKSSYKSAILTFEHDCQKSLFRVLEHIGYKELWASGSSILEPGYPDEWRTNARHGTAGLICEKLSFLHEMP